MIVIADSGSTKTDWRIIEDDGTIHQEKTPGLNPYFIDANDVGDSLVASLLKDFKDTAKEVFFYGAGCASSDNKKKMSGGLGAFFSKAKITVNDDLLGAARAAAGREKSICCILGTGSNSCLFDGENVVQQSPSMGYILGDEGSGTHLGKLLLNEYFYGKVPHDIAVKLQDRFDMSREAILEKVYKSERPNAFLASFSKFLFDNRRNFYVRQLIEKSFTQFIEGQVLPLSGARTLEVHFVGSVAFYFNELLREVMYSKNLKIGKVLESPIAGLTLYHK